MTDDSWVSAKKCQGSGTVEDGVCTFCEIVAGRLPAQIHYEDDEIVVFDNHLDWVPVMLLLVPRRHMSQRELWNSGPLMSRMASLAVRMGQEHSPDGFRILSNFGRDALQTQQHGHLHVLGGSRLGRYVTRTAERP